MVGVKSICGYPQVIIRALSNGNGAAKGGPMQRVKRRVYAFGNSVMPGKNR
jgi:hypothetical protein